MTAQRNLIVTGAHGFVAGSVLAQAGADWQVHALSRQPPPECPGKVRWHRCDPAAAGALARLFREVQPVAVIHTAAAADIDFCQGHPDLARAANVDLTRQLADLCASAGARLVFCSTDTVFDGEHAPYDEDAVPEPVNFYAETKVAAERIVAGLGELGMIARLSLVVGLPVLGAGNSFLARMVAAFKAGQTVTVSAREIRTPVDVLTAGRALLELAARDLSGIIHLAGHDRLNRFEMAQQIAARLGFAPQLVLAREPAPGRAPRPRDVSLANAKACAQLHTPMRTLDEGLSLILQNAAPRTA